MSKKEIYTKSVLLHLREEDHMKLKIFAAMKGDTVTGLLRSMLDDLLSNVDQSVFGAFHYMKVKEGGSS